MRTLWERLGPRSRNIRKGVRRKRERNGWVETRNETNSGLIFCVSGAWQLEEACERLGDQTENQDQVYERLKWTRPRPELLHFIVHHKISWNGQLKLRYIPKDKISVKTKSICSKLFVLSVQGSKTRKSIWKVNWTLPGRVLVVRRSTGFEN